MTPLDLGRAAVTISLHTEVPDAVAVTETPIGVSLQLGDDHCGLSILGPLDAVHAVVVEADRQLSHLRCR